ncbi:MAG: hypothetical protein ACPGOV_02710 [Magnetovibrionaceae bacterium]
MQPMMIPSLAGNADSNQAVGTLSLVKTTQNTTTKTTKRKTKTAG